MRRNQKREIWSFLKIIGGTICGILGCFQNRWKKNIFCTFCEIECFLKIIRGTMWHYGALSKTLKKHIFANFVKFGVFLKIIRGTMWHYGALSKTLKIAFWSRFGSGN